MIKITSHLPILLFSIFLLSACGGSGDDKNGNSSSNEPALGNTPAIPSNIELSFTANQIYISWDADTNANTDTIFWNTTGQVTNTDNSFIVENASSFHYNDAIIGNTYYFAIMASNSTSDSPLSNEYSITFDVPNSPQNLIVMPGKNQVNITWDSVNNVSDYELYWNTSGGVTKEDNKIDIIENSQYLHTQLNSSATYYYAIAAKNVIGSSQLSPEKSSTTPLDAPINVAVSGGVGQNTISWDLVSDATQYDIYWNTTGNVGIHDNNLSAGNNIQFIHSQLAPATTYYYAIIARNSLASSELSANKTGLTTPAAPQNFATNSTTDTITLSWDAVSGASNYSVFWNTTGAVNNSDNSLPLTSNTQITHAGLTAGTTYYYIVTANNVSGSSALSHISAQLKPSSPQNVKTISTTDSITLSWNSVPGVTAYTVYWNNSGSVTISDSSLPSTNNTQITHSGLSTGSTYYYMVVAANTFGKNASSQVSAQLIPNAPQNPTTSSTESVITLSWNSAPGAINYTVYWNTTGSVNSNDNSLPITDNTQINHTGLSTESTYYYIVTANNSSGSSTSDQVSAQLLPKTPQNIKATANTNGINISWNPVLGASDYTVYWNTSGSVNTEDFQLNSNSAQIDHTGLTLDTTYYYRVSANNNSGGSISNEISQRYAKPAVPQNLQANADSYQVALSWNVVNTADSYIVFWNTTGSVSKVDQNFVINGNTFTHDNRLPNTEYFYAIAATNVVGESLLSNEVSVTTKLPSPQNVKVINGLGTPIIRWDNVTGADSYSVYWNTNNGVTSNNGTTINTGSNTYAEHIDGVDGTTYYYAVGAHNAAGTSSLSVEQSITINKGQFVNPATGTTQLNDIAYSGNSFVAVGNNGRILNSTTGDNWNIITPLTTQHIHSVIWANKQFVAVGVNCSLVSSDGINWTLSTTGFSSNRLNDVAWSTKLNLYIAVGSGRSSLFSSTDGMSWQPITSTNTNTLHAITWSSDKAQYIAVGSNKTILSSSDGAVWNNANADQSFGEFIDIVWTGTQYVAVSTSIVATSPDGATWTFGVAPRSTYAIAWTGTEIVALGDDGRVSTRSDTDPTWTEKSVDMVTRYHAATWDGSKLVAVDFSGIITQGIGNTWSYTNAFLGDKFLRSSIWSEKHNQFVAVGDFGTILTSTDGLSWNFQTFLVSGTPISLPHLRDIVWTGTQYVIVGQSNTILTSSNAIDWTTQVPNLASSYMIESIIWTGEQFVAVGGKIRSSLIMTSPDALTWTIQGSDLGDQLYDITWSGTQYIAVGGNLNGSLVVSSPNAITWSVPQNVAALTFNRDLYAISWNGSQFLIGGQGNILLRSTNGSSWQQSATIVGSSINDIIWTGEYYVEVGDRGRIAISFDGSHWFKRTIDTEFTLKSISSNSNQFVIMGYFSAIYTF